MTTNHTTEQLKKGYEAFNYLATYFDAHNTMPPAYEDFMRLPLEVTDPRTGASRIVLIGLLTPEDISDFAASEEAAARDRFLAELDHIPTAKENQ